MKKYLISITLFLFATHAFALGKPCKATSDKSIPSNKILFFYRYTKAQKTYFLPFAKISNDKLSNASTDMIPQRVKLYNLENDKVMEVTFTNERNNTDDCISVGIAKSKPVSGLLFATVPLAKQFNFKPDAVAIKQFQATISSPCKTCKADKLIATSHLLDQDQYWNVKQYRYDAGVAVSTWNDRLNKLTPVAQNCALCSD